MLFAKEFRRQLLASISVNILTIGFGVSIGWSSASLLLLEHVDSPLPSGPLTKLQSSWVGSLMPLGGFTGNILCGLFAGRFGRKTVAMTAGVSQFLGWLLLYIAQNVYYLYVGRFMQGLCGACVYAVLPIFVAEISDNRIRGTLGSLLMLASNFGVLMSFILGYYVNLTVVPLILMSSASLFILTMAFQHETPQYLLRAGFVKEAESALRYYRNLSDESKEEQGTLECEMKLLKSNCMPSSDQDGQPTVEERVTWKDFVTPAAKKAIIIGLFLLWLKQFCGLTVMVFYAGHIFAASGSSISPNMAAIVIGVVQLFGTYTASLLVDRFGRKVLLTISSVGTGFSLIVLAIFTYLQSLGYPTQAFGWVPMVSASSILYLGSCGMLPMPFVVLSEIMPQKIRSTGASIGITSLWFFGFVSVQLYQPLLLLIGMHGVLCCFATCAFIGTIFVNTYMFETKGKSFEEITLIMEGRRPEKRVGA